MNDTDLSRYIEQKALADGALLVGYTKIRRVEPVIVFAYPFSDKWFFKHPLSITKRLGKEYLISQHVQHNIAGLLQKEGYIAHKKTIFSVYGDFRPLAVSAGLGEWGRNGIIVNKDHGSGLLFSAIFTNAPLGNERKEEQPPREHCTNCGQCIQSCPSNAFENNFFHTSRCYPRTIRGCSECLNVCKKS